MYSLNTELTEAAKSGFIHEQKLEEIATNETPARFSNTGFPNSKM